MVPKMPPTIFLKKNKGEKQVIYPDVLNHQDQAQVLGFFVGYSFKFFLCPFNFLLIFLVCLF
jgi:hypothetical protein